MRPHSLIFRLSAATAVAGLVLAQAIPQPALAQPAPPGTAPAASGQQATDPPARAGWLAKISGTVSFHTQDDDQWGPAAMNYPVAAGNSFWTEPNASAQITISSSRIVLAGGTELDVSTLDSNGLQATTPQGEIYLQLRDLAQNETWSLQTPRGLVTFSGAGRYDVAAGDTQNPTTVTVLEGSAQVTGPGLTLQVAQGQTATITGTDTFQGTVGQAQLDAFLTSMQQAEQPAPAAQAPAVVAAIPGGDDLSAYGSWSQTTDYGQAWYPQVAAGWAPYRDGHWAFIPPWGWTWVDDAPWGFAPFHYGRWFQDGGRWGWTPGVVAYDGPPVYAPALVAFIGFGVGVGIGAALVSGSIGWVPLGPREAYHPWYRASDGYLRSVNRREVTNPAALDNRNAGINNFANRSAATVVPASALAESRPIREMARPVDPRTLATARPVAGAVPIRPTAATAGITPGLARQMRLAPAPAGTAAAARTAPGPEIHAGPTPLGVAARPALRAPYEHPGAAPEHGAAPPAGTPERTEPGARPGVVAAPGAMPALRTPAEREAGPPPIEHPAPGAPGERHEVTPAQEVRPGAPAPGVERPGEQVEHPRGEAPAERPALTGPRVEGAPETRAPVREEEHPVAPEAPRPLEEHAAPRPEEHPAPRPEEHPAPRPEEHAAPRPEEHPAPRPEEHPAPRPEVHAAPRPEPRPAPHPAPAAHPAPAPHPAAAPHEEEKKK